MPSVTEGVQFGRRINLLGQERVLPLFLLGQGVLLGIGQLLPSEFGPKGFELSLGGLLLGLGELQERVVLAVLADDRLARFVLGAIADFEDAHAFVGEHMVIYGVVGHGCIWFGWLVWLVGCLLAESEASSDDESHEDGGINHDGYEPEFSDGFLVHLVGFVWLVWFVLPCGLDGDSGENRTLIVWFVARSPIR